MAGGMLNLREKIQERLSCSICLELFTRPKVLPCGHTFCQHCLQDLASRRVPFQCPNCRRQVRLPPQGVAGLLDSRVIANLCEGLQTSLSGETREQPRSVNRCSVHPFEVLKMYREQCQVPVCDQCLEQARDDRRTTTIKNAGKGHHHGKQRQGEHQLQKLGLTGAEFDPVGVTVSEEGEIFVAHCQYKRIEVWTLQRTCIRQFPTVVLSGKARKPHDVAMDGEGNLWMVGYKKSSEFAVQYNKQGEVLRKFHLRKTGWHRGVAVDTRRNHILITQKRGWLNKHGKVLVFRPDGTRIQTVGQQQGMKYPWHITVDGEGNILVSEISNHCVYVYNVDGQFLFQFGCWGSGDGQLKFPHGICTDRAGNIIVADSGNRRVEMFDKTGKFLKHVSMGTIVHMGIPRAVAMATQGQLVVTDYANHVTIFQND